MTSFSTNQNVQFLYSPLEPARGNYTKVAHPAWIFSPLSRVRETLVEVVSLFTQFNGDRNSFLSLVLLISVSSLILGLINVWNNFISMCCFYSVVISTVVSKEFSANHSTSLNHTYLSLFVIGPIVLEQRQCSLLSLTFNRVENNQQKQFEPST